MIHQHATMRQPQVGSDALFDIDSVLVDSPRLKRIKELDIQTHHAPGIEDPWLAIPMKAARELVKGCGPREDQLSGVFEIMSHYCRYLEEAGMVFMGDSEREVTDAALAWSMSNETSPSTGEKGTKQ